MVVVSLVTLGSPDQVTGGYLYHRRMADAAPGHGAELLFVSFARERFVAAARRAGAVMALTRRQGAQLIVVDSIAAGMLAPWLRIHQVDVPMVAILHQPPGGIDHGPVVTWVRAVLDSSTYRRARRLLSASQALAGELESRGFPRSRIRVVPPGRDVALAPDGPVGDLRRGHHVAFLSVGNWVARKGILPLLDAFATLPSEAASLHLVGDQDRDPSYTARVRARMGAADLAGRVVAHGPVTKEDVAAFYAAADVFVLPSWTEPYGTVYGEAMSAGLPVIGWRAGNVVNLAEDGRQGVLVAPGDVQALAAAMRRLALDDAYRRSLATGARQRAQSLPTWEETAGLFFSNVREVLEEVDAAR
ncbi:MAG TPA: glycosyltransferase family 4 protein [Acidimicrobiales bacterium]|nr:glycosyltransferase family 4 protein [Acidimicrobiales bacterium]